MKSRSRALFTCLVIFVIFTLAWLLYRPSADFSFAVVGDTQGSPLFETIIEDINRLDVNFILHLGDCVPISTAETIKRFSETLGKLEVPVHITPGNHDVKGNATLFYSSFGRGDYHFDYSGVRFISLDSSNQSISPSQFSWLESLLNGGKNRKKVVFTHIPSLDPRQGRSHGFLDPKVAMRFRAMMEEHGVELVIAGHIHMFNRTRAGPTEYVISGGGGATLQAEPDRGGYHHYLLFHVDDGSVELRVHEVDAIADVGGELEVVGKGYSINISLTELQAMKTLVGDSLYQNSLGNWRGGGTYLGVLASDLVELVGGMSPGDLLRVESRDGYYQEYCYGNINPNATWRDIQGDMILAYEHNGKTVPEWEGGFSIAFLPPDGSYANEDCLRTSCKNQGCGVYDSAGARWVKDVVRIQVIEV